MYFCELTAETLRSVLKKWRVSHLATRYQTVSLEKVRPYVQALKSLVPKDFLFLLYDPQKDKGNTRHLWVLVGLMQAFHDLSSDDLKGHSTDLIMPSVLVSREKAV